MCGIVGYIGSAGATGIILDGLKRLEYRGYDSAGRRGAGRRRGSRSGGAPAGIKQPRSVAPGAALDGPLGIGHTRWATHGRPSEENAHPHTDCTGSIVVVHNGIIENYLPIKERLQAEGHVFKSETDTEVLAHLIEQHLGRRGRARPRRCGARWAEVRGAYAIGRDLATASPDRARRGQARRGQRGGRARARARTSWPRTSRPSWPTRATS